MYNNEDEKYYLDKIIQFLSLKEDIDKIKSNCENINSNILNYIIFPNEDYNNIVEFINKFNNNFENHKKIESKEYDDFSNKFSNFLEKIKKIFEENEIYTKFKDINKNIKELPSKLNEISINCFDKVNESDSMNMFDITDENKKSYNYFSYINKDFKNSNNISNDNENQIISFACFDCKNQPHYFCKNHCYQYFCKDCIKIFNNINSHQFENIDVKKENSKVLFINSFINLFKVYCQIADKIFKLSQESIIYPILKNFNDINSQAEFLKDIYNFKFENYDSFDNNHQSGLCQPIKDALIKTFDLNILPKESIEDEYNFMDEKLIIEEDYLKIKSNYVYKSYYSNILVKNEMFMKEITKEYIDKNFKDCKFLLTYKNIINELIINQCKIKEEKLNYKYNFIIPNLNLNFTKGGEIYYPPYGWFGIGLNIENIYHIKEESNKSNDSKAIAYYAFNGDKIKEQLYNIIMNQDKNSIYKNQQKVKNHNLNLYHKITLAELKTGIIYFNNKKYKIALMARVPSNKISQLPDSDIWELRQNEVEFIRIIIKEIMI